MKKLLIVLLLSVALPFGLMAQKTIKGQVFDENGKPMVGASVMASGTKKGTQTDKNGNFSLNVKGDEDASIVLSVSSVNYSTQIVTTDGKSNVTVRMKREVVTGDDVVVVGYQTLKRKDVLAPVSSVSAAQLKDIPITSAAEALNGRLAGVTANVTEGSPDADVRIRVRGGGSITQDNSPLYIIDGVQVESGLNSLAVSDIASVDVLKDASSTAIYGARGANGVVIITTKSGRSGKASITYNAFVGVKTLANELDVLDPYDYAVLQWERTRPSSSDWSTYFTKFGVYNNFDSLKTYKDTPKVNWQDKVLGRHAFITSHNLGISGGTKKFNYNASYSLNKEQGIVITSDYIRHLGNLKLEYRPIKKLKIGASVRYNDQVINGVSTSSEGGASLNRLRQVIKYKPFLKFNETLDQLDPDLFDETNGNSLGLINPLALLRAEERRKHQVTTNGGFNVQYTIVKNLTFKTSIGYDFKRIRQFQFSDSITSDAQINGAGLPIINLDSSTVKTLNNSNVLTWTVNNYKKNHDFTVLAGHEIYNIDGESVSHRRRDIPLFTKSSDAVSNNNLGVEDVGRGFPVKRIYHSKLLSFFGKLNYAYKDRYLASFSFRADGSSKFANENRWGYFPSASLAWRISKEKFLENVKWLSDAKIRFGYGQAGNNRILDYQFLSLLSQPKPYGLNDSINNGYYQSAALANYNIKWETNVSRNFGLDLSLMKGKIDFTIDIYKNTANNLLLQVPVSPILGYTNQIQNVGSTYNKGVEIQLGATVMNRKNFTWKISLNNSWNKNMVAGLANGVDTLFGNASWSPSGFNDFIAVKGSSVGEMFGFVTDGFYKASDFNTNTANDLKTGVVKSSLYAVTPGTLKLKDLDGNGIINAADRKVIGNATPKFTGGLNQQFSLFKSFDLSIFINWRVGGDVMNANRIEFTNTYTPWANTLTDVNDRYRTIDNNGNLVTSLVALDSINANAKLWKPLGNNAGNNAFLLHSWAIEDGSFLRINNLTLGYVLPSKWIHRMRMKNFRIYATVNNLAVFSKYKGYDPEVDVRSGNTANGAPTPNVDYSAYPRSRSFIFGLNVAF